MSGPRVSVVVVNLNGERLLPDLLDSLAAQTHAPHEVIVVDNASQDFSRELVRARGGALRLVESERNVGASQGRNLGTRAAQGDVLAFVDNDSVADPGWIAEAVAALDRHPRWGAVGSLVYYDANRDVVNGCGARLNRSLFGADHGFGEPAPSCRFREEPCMYGMSNGLFVRREAAERVGAWDHHMFYYYEDTDFCLRLWLEGFAVGTAPGSVLGHKLSLSRGFIKAYLSERHRIRIGLKYLTASEWMLWLGRELSRPGGGPRLFSLATTLRMWAYNLVRLPGVLAFRRRYRTSPGHAEWRHFLDPGWEPPPLPFHNFRPAGKCPPRDRIEASLCFDLWRYGVYPPEAFEGGAVGQWLDGDSAIDVTVSGRCRRITARVYATQVPGGTAAHLDVRDAEGRTAWKQDLRLMREGWTELAWPCDLPAGHYRLLVRGRSTLTGEGGYLRKLLLAYSRICFCED